MEEVVLGKVIATYGLKGEVKIYSNTDFAKKRYKKGNEVILFNPETNHRVTLKSNSYKQVKGLDVVSFENYLDINLIEKFIGYEVRINKPDEKLEKGSYYYADLIGSKVLYNENVIGEVSEILDNGTQKTLRIKPTNKKKKDILLPFIETFITSIDVSTKQIVINPIEGMIEND